MKIIQYKLEAYINHLGNEYWDTVYQGQVQINRCRAGCPSRIDDDFEEYGHNVERLYGPDDIFQDGNEF